MTLVGLNVAVASTLDDSTDLPCRTPPSGDEMTGSGQTGMYEPQDQRSCAAPVRMKLGFVRFQCELCVSGSR